MKKSCLLLISLVYLSVNYTCIFGQAPRTEQAAATTAGVVAEAVKEAPLPVIIHLAKGGNVVADEVTEDKDGVWYKRGSISTFLDRAKVRSVERPSPPTDAAAITSNAIQGEGRWRLSDAIKVKDFFQATFNRALPLTAFGQSDLHNRWGWDHRNGMDVGLHPDSPEGRALIAFLQTNSIPFLAFRGPIPGIATGPHIHVGNRSPRLLH